LLEEQTEGISHGSATLTVHIRDYRPRYVVSKEQSLLFEYDAGTKPFSGKARGKNG
jgi:hypothetical protein